MQELKSDLLRTKYTRVFHEPDSQMKYNAPHHFKVFKADIDPNVKGLTTGFDVSDCVGGIDFQEGPIKECGVNGVCNEDLIAMVITRLEHFQKSEYACRENALAITKLEEAMLWLRKRTMGREQRGVDGTHTV